MAIHEIRDPATNELLGTVELPDGQDPAKALTGYVKSYNSDFSKPIVLKAKKRIAIREFLGDDATTNLGKLVIQLALKHFEDEDFERLGIKY